MTTLNKLRIVIREMVRAALVNKNGLKKGAWTKEEDEKLRAYISRYGHWNWRQLPKFAGLSRCGKSCRLRWMNYLRPDVKRGNYSKEEEDLIVKLHDELGNKWSKIAAQLPGRTDNDIKNHWHTHLKKRKTQSHEASIEEKSDDISHSSMLTDITPSQQIAMESSTAHREATSGLFCNIISYDPACSSGPNYITEEGSMASLIDEKSSGDFWTQPFVGDTSFDQDDQYSFALITEEIRYKSSYTSYEDDHIDVPYHMM